MRGPCTSCRKPGRLVSLCLLLAFNVNMKPSLLPGMRLFCSLSRRDRSRVKRMRRVLDGMTIQRKLNDITMVSQRALTGFSDIVRKLKNIPKQGCIPMHFVGAASAVEHGIAFFFGQRDLVALAGRHAAVVDCYPHMRCILRQQIAQGLVPGSNFDVTRDDEGMHGSRRSPTQPHRGRVFGLVGRREDPTSKPNLFVCFAKRLGQSGLVITNLVGAFQNAQPNVDQGLKTLSPSIDHHAVVE